MIIHFCPCFVDLENETGGVANIVRQIALRSAERGMRTTLICGNREMGMAMRNPGKYECQGVQWQVLGQHRNPLLGPIRELREILHALPSDSIAHVHTCFSLFTEACLLEAKKRRITTVFTPHGKLNPQAFLTRSKLKSLWWRFLGARAVSSATHIVTSSPTESLEMNMFSELRTIMRGNIPNGYSPLPFVKMERLVDEPYILFLGYLEPRKQPMLLLEAYSLCMSKDRYKLVVAGPDKVGHQEELVRFVTKKGLLSRVHFYGPAYGSEKWNLLSNARCLCLPSMYEGMPVVLSESIGAKLPSIASRRCNFEHIAATGVGHTVDSFNPVDWALAIDQVCLDDDIYKNMKEACMIEGPRFQWDTIVDQWIDLYRSISNA